MPGRKNRSDVRNLLFILSNFENAATAFTYVTVPFDDNPDARYIRMMKFQ